MPARLSHSLTSQRYHASAFDGDYKKAATRTQMRRENSSSRDDYVNGSR